MSFMGLLQVIQSIRNWITILKGFLLVAWMTVLMLQDKSKGLAADIIDIRMVVDTCLCDF